MKILLTNVRTQIFPSLSFKFALKRPVTSHRIKYITNQLINNIDKIINSEANSLWTAQETPPVSCDQKNYSRVDKKNQLDVTFCILYFSYNSCSTCFGQPCAHHQELTTAWCYMSLFVFFISLLIVAQHVSGNHVPIIRSWRLRVFVCHFLYSLFLF